MHKLRGKSKSLSKYKSKLPLANVPELYYIGTDNSNPHSPIHIMVMDLLGPSIEDLFQSCKKEFDLTTVINIGIQMFELIWKVHEMKIIHRDIKPDNFLIGHK